jgi:hypothetical protein
MQTAWTFAWAISSSPRKMRWLTFSRAPVTLS